MNKLLAEPVEAHNLSGNQTKLKSLNVLMQPMLFGIESAEGKKGGDENQHQLFNTPFEFHF